MVHHILVVDDEPLLADAVRDMLISCGYAVSVAGSGGEALDIMERIKEGKIDLVLSDIQMPGMDGRDLSRTIRTSPFFQGTLIILSSGSLKLTAEEIRAVGANGFLKKPYGISDLTDLVESLLLQQIT